MHEALRAHFQALQDALETTTISTEGKQINATRMGRLAVLYTRFGESHESRYLEEMSGLVRLVLRELEGCPKAQALDPPFRDTLTILHEELGVPALNLKSPSPPRAAQRTNKTRHPAKKAS
jgi:hypothetical protein